jgi:hypothetical protein
MHGIYTKLKIMGMLYLLHVVRCVDKEHQGKYYKEKSIVFDQQ